MAASPDREQGVYMISAAADLAGMHPQTLRIYESRGLITPKRSPKNTRLYSQEDVERLRRIQHLTADEGRNLAGVEAVMRLESELEKARGELGRMRRRTAEIEQRMAAEIDAVKRSMGSDIVPYGAYDPNLDAPGGESVRIPVERKRRSG